MAITITRHQGKQFAELLSTELQQAVFQVLNSDSETLIEDVLDFLLDGLRSSQTGTCAC